MPNKAIIAAINGKQPPAAREPNQRQSGTSQSLSRVAPRFPHPSLPISQAGSSALRRPGPAVSHHSSRATKNHTMNSLLEKWRVFFIFIFFKNIFYTNIFSISQFTVLYSYRPAGGGRGTVARQGGGRGTAARQGLICK